MIATNVPRAKRKPGRLALNIFALVFTIAPVYLLGQSIWRYVAATSSALSAANDNKSIAAHKVSSQQVALFREPVVSITFDDGWGSVATTAAPILSNYAIATTEYIITDRVGQYNYMTLDQLHALKAAGHEIASHSASHVPLGKASESSIEHELTSSKEFIVKNHLADSSSVDFAFPYGSYSPRSVELGVNNYATLRNSNGNPRDGIDNSDINIASNFKPEYIIGYGVEADTKLSDIQAALAYAKTNNGWLVLIFHQIDTSQSEYSVSPRMLEDILSAIQNASIKTATMHDAYASRENK